MLFPIHLSSVFLPLTVSDPPVGLQASPSDAVPLSDVFILTLQSSKQTAAAEAEEVTGQQRGAGADSF